MKYEQQHRKPLQITLIRPWRQLQPARHLSSNGHLQFSRKLPAAGGSASRHLQKVAALLWILWILPAFPGCNRAVVSEEPEEEDCVCTMQYDPVCGSDGNTYGNACVAECEGVTSYVEGECSDS